MIIVGNLPQLLATIAVKDRTLEVAIVDLSLECLLRAVAAAPYPYC